MLVGGFRTLYLSQDHADTFVSIGGTANNTPVAVTNVNGTAVVSTVTDANGKYSFDLLPAGVAYKVSIDNNQAVLADYLPTITGAGTTATDSSNGSATSVVLTNNGDSDLTLDFGFRLLEKRLFRWKPRP